MRCIGDTRDAAHAHMHLADPGGRSQEAANPQRPSANLYTEVPAIRLGKNRTVCPVCRPKLSST